MTHAFISKATYLLHQSDSDYITVSAQIIILWKHIDGYHPFVIDVDCHLTTYSWLKKLISSRQSS